MLMIPCHYREQYSLNNLVNSTTSSYDTEQTGQWLSQPTVTHAYVTVLRLSSVCTECIVAKRCMRRRALTITIDSLYRKSYMINRLAQK